MAVNSTINYTQAANVGQGYYSAIPGSTGVVLVANGAAGPVTLVIQRYGQAPFELTNPASNSYIVSIDQIQTIGLLAGAAGATGNLFIATAIL
jgi:hypothetical protein